MDRRTALAALAAGCALPAAAADAPAAAASAPRVRDVLDTPALASPLAARSLVNALARAGSRIVAAGQRGHVLTSADAGQTWLPSRVPVSSDLVALSFPSPQAGFAVGHDGVVLASADGGLTWQRQLDGRGFAPLLAGLGGEAQRLAAQGAENPLLDVWFADAQRGIAVGAFGLAFETDDGGRRWQPLLPAIDNPKGLHLYAVRGVGSAVYLAGEQGLLLKRDAGTGGRFRALELPYKGTLFGLVGHERALLAFGLRGTLLRSTDGGTAWQTVASGVNVGHTAGTLDERGRFIVVSQAGHVLVSSDEGASFKPAEGLRAAPAAAVVAAGTRLVIGGPRGVQSLPWA